MTAPIEVDSTTFETAILQSDKPVMLDFWAPWCGPCRMLTPTIEELSKEYAGKVKVGKLNTDDNQQTAAGFAVTSIPTCILFKDGEIVDKVVGAPPKSHFDAMLDGVTG